MLRGTCVSAAKCTTASARASERVHQRGAAHRAVHELEASGAHGVLGQVREIAGVGERVDHDHAVVREARQVVA